MRLRALALLLALPASALAAELVAAPAQPKAVLVVIDGVRSLELEGRAVDDEGRSVTAESLFPNLLALARSGAFLPDLQISNPVGISLPAYADLFAGRRQERILVNAPPAEDFRSHYPTLFQAARKSFGRMDGVAVVASWDALCKISVTPEGGSDNDFFRDCGWRPGLSKPEMHKGVRSDLDNFLLVSTAVAQLHPRLLFVGFGDADEEAHLHKEVRARAGLRYGIYPYHEALRRSDYLLGRVWAMLQEDPFYRGSTYLVVTTDHGRDDVPDPAQWWDHGKCRHSGGGQLCSGCRRAFAVVVGPGVRPAVVKGGYTHADLAPTLARLLGLELPSASGRPIAEALPTAP